MERCPLCRATLQGAGTCRRCKAELQTVRRVERESQALAGAAMHRLCLGDLAASRRLARLAMDLRATPEIRALWRLVMAVPGPPDAGPETGDEGQERPVSPRGSADGTGP